MSKNIIKCPYCGAEYMPAEIYLPDAFLGHPKDIQKDLSGKIKNWLGKDMDLLESYRCDWCNRKFTIEASVKFHTNSNSKDFGKKHKTKLTKPALFLDEE